MYIIEHRIVCINPYESSVVRDIVWCIWHWSTHPLVIVLRLFTGLLWSVRGEESACNRNEYQEHFLGLKVAGA